MPAHAWLVHFPDADSTMLESRRDLPEPGEEVIPGWVVTDSKVPKREYDLEVWVTAKARRQTIRRERMDRS